MIKAANTVLSLIVVLLLLAAPAICQTPLQAPPKPLSAQIAPIVQNWISPGKILLVVDNAQVLKASVAAVSTAAAVANGAAAPDLTTPDGIAEANGYITSWFGGVLAVAPSSTTVLNTDTSLYDLPLADLMAVQPLPFLINSLTQDQFDLLGSTGLGLNDLTSNQQTLFRAMIPDPLEMVSKDAAEPQFNYDPNATPAQQAKLDAVFEQQQVDYDRQKVQVPLDQVIDQIRLRACLNQSFEFTDSAGNDHTFQDNDNLTDGTMKLTCFDDYPVPQSGAGAKQLTALLTAETTNFLKPSDINWKMQALKAQVSVAGVKTVDDVVGALAKATSLELYADAGYGQETAFFGGDLSTAHSAVDLMQALALSVCGAWRKVGPAYVLTDDVEGLGARQAFLRDVVQSWSNRMKTAGGDVSRKLYQLDWQTNLSDYQGDPIAVPSDQLKKICTSNGNTTGPVKYSDLPATLQTYLADQLKDQNSGVDDDDAAAGKPKEGTITADTEVTVVNDINLDLDLPSDGNMGFLDFNVDGSSQTGDGGRATQTPIPMSEANRAVICAPRTASEARKTVDDLSELGFNTLIIDVFNNGRTYFDNSVIPPETADAGSVLSAATAEAALKHTMVIAAVDMFCWRKDGDSASPAAWPSSIEQDVNVFGEPSDVGSRRLTPRTSIYSGMPGGDFIDRLIGDRAKREGWVSPLDPAVRKAMPLLIKQLAASPGLSGLVFQDVSPPGYGMMGVSMTSSELGYSLSNRVAFLRERHVDPVDLGLRQYASMDAPANSIPSGPFFSLRIPGFHQRGPWLAQWSKYRADSVQSLMKECFLEAQASNSKLSLLLTDPAFEMNIYAWKNPDDLLPTAEQNPKTMYFNIPVMEMLANGDSLSKELDAYNGFAHSADVQVGGVAFDLETGAVDDNVPKMLDRLKPYLAPPQAQTRQ
jgi:hypothetical protein